jgi:hypothetical protein
LAEVRLGAPARENNFHRIKSCLLEALSYLNVYINVLTKGDYSYTTMTTLELKDTKTIPDPIHTYTKSVRNATPLVIDNGKCINSETVL